MSTKQRTQPGYWRCANCRARDAATAGTINAKFANQRDHTVSLWWVDGGQVHHVTQVEAGATERLTTTVGHRFVAKRVVDGEEKEILELAVEPKHAKTPLVIPRDEL